MPETCLTLLAKLPENRGLHSEKLPFAGVGHRDVYNISAPFDLNGRQVIAGRVESREVEHSDIIFFAQDQGQWLPIASAPTFPGLQDPCVTFVGAELILGGVRFPTKMADGSVGWRMEFYRGPNLENLRLFLTGPDKMKDIRLVEFTDQRVGVFTRPQGAKGGRGQIGFFVAAHLESITATAMADAPLFQRQCRPDEWLGANEAHALANGLIGVLGHIAYFDRNEHRHYYPMVFAVNPHTGEATAPEIIVTRTDFSAGPAKRPDLVDVMFSGGLIRHSDGSATLYAGLSDAEAGCVQIQDPLIRFENSIETIAFTDDLGSAKAAQM